MTELSQLGAGDPVWMLNGERNRARRAKIVKGTYVGGDWVFLVQREPTDSDRSEDDGLFEFYSSDGSPVTDGVPDFKGKRMPRLVPFNEPRALELERRRLHREQRDKLGEAASAFRADPTQATYDTMLRVVENWGRYSIGLPVNVNVSTILRQQGLPDVDDVGPDE